MLERFPSRKQAAEYAKEYAASENVIVKVQTGEDGFHYVSDCRLSNLEQAWQDDWYQKNVAPWKYARTKKDDWEREEEERAKDIRDQMYEDQDFFARAERSGWPYLG